MSHVLCDYLKCGGTSLREMKSCSPILETALVSRDWVEAERLISRGHGLRYVHHGRHGLHTALWFHAPLHIIELLLGYHFWINKNLIKFAIHVNVNRSVMRLLIQKDMVDYAMHRAIRVNQLAYVAECTQLGANNRVAHWLAVQYGQGKLIVYLDNIRLIEAICSMFIPRLGIHSTLRLNKDCIMKLRDCLCFSN
jgi:hypothetical protein